MKSKKRITGVYIFSMIFILGFSTTLCGCRKSEVLEDVVVDEDAALLNDQEAMSIEKDGEDQNKQNNQQQDSDNKKDWEDIAALADDTADSSEANARDIHSSNTDDGTASKDGQTQADDSTAGNGANANQTGSGDGSGNTENNNSNGSAVNNGSDSENDDNSDSEDDPSGSTNPSGGDQNPTSKKDGPRKTVTDGNGIEQSIPEDVHTVTAVGEAASVVEMLGGSGRLLASSEDVTSNSLASTLFADVASGEVETWWSGDGSTQISDENFEKLMQAAPDVCFEISGEQTFSEEQISALQEAGIGYMALPAFTSVANIEEAVSIVANALETNESTGVSALKIAANYNDWVASTIDEVENASENKETIYSIYISEWRDDITYTRILELGYGQEPDFVIDFPESSGVVNGQGSGVAIAWTCWKEEAISALWLDAGVENVMSYGSVILDSKHRTGMYVFPYIRRFGVPHFSSGDYFCYAEEYWLVNNNEYWLAPYSYSEGFYLGAALSGQIKEGEQCLGTAVYPAIVVANEEIKAKIEASPQWKPGFLDGSYDIAGDYDIYVNPSGLASWADGSVETPLEAFWIANKVGGSISDSTLNKRIKSFYQIFFGITLSDDKIRSIVN